MYDNYTYGTLARGTKQERRRPGSLKVFLKNGVESKALTRLADVRFKTATTLGFRNPVLRMMYVKEVHSDDEHTESEQTHVREKPGRNPVVTQFLVDEIDPAAEAYRKRNTKSGQRQPKKRVCGDPLAPASEIGMILPLDVPIDFFTPEFYNALTVKEHARYANTGVAFPLTDFAFDEVHEEWKTMGKKEFMAMYGDDVLDQYDVPTPEEIAAIPDSDAEDDEDIEINLADTDDDEEGMEVDDDV
ncbi:hypothetical protein DFH09DRAFT_1080702 [Mycena vulgaris]|nr:hypothetical protein DFH09DRAFT_1080702 [Mycena vulgaris]